MVLEFPIQLWTKPETKPNIFPNPPIALQQQGLILLRVQGRQTQIKLYF